MDLNMKKKVIVALLSLSLVLSGLTACSSKKTAEVPQITEEQTIAEETVEQEAEETADQEETAEEPQETQENDTEETTQEQAQETAQAPQQTPEQTSQTEPAPAAQQPAPAEEPAAPAEEPKAEEAPQGIADGTYSISIGFSGGTGKASITNPVTLYVKNGTYTAKVVWTSMYYDYMKVGGTKYTNENVGGNSTFTIPVPDLDTYFTVIGDTTAMSSPHEIEYTLYFDSTTLK